MENFLGNWWLAKQLGVNGGQKRCSEGKLTYSAADENNIVNLELIEFTINPIDLFDMKVFLISEMNFSSLS